MATELTREAKQRRILEARRLGALQLDGSAGPLQPPFHVHGVDMLYFLCRFDPDTTRGFVPPEVATAKSNWGVIAAYVAPSGWEIAPYSAFYMGLEIEGYDSPDGFPCIYQSAGFYGDKAFDIFRSIYNRDVHHGWTRFDFTSGQISCEAGIGEQVLLRMGGRPRSADFERKQGVNRYASPRPGGGMNVFSAPFTCPFVELDDAFVEVGECVPYGLTAPAEITWPVWCHDSSIAFSVPSEIASPREEVESASRAAETVEVFGRLGRPAIVVEPTGRVLRVNGAASSFVSEGRLPIIGGSFRPGKEGAAAMTSVMAATSQGEDGFVSERFVLRGEALGEKIVGQCMALNENEIIIFFENPARPVEARPEASLQLLGLTAAESRIAAAVGSGKSALQAAHELKLSPHTVRSALKSIFGKLSIGRQSELARIVTRLEGEVGGRSTRLSDP